MFAAQSTAPDLGCTSLTSPTVDQGGGTFVDMSTMPFDDPDDPDDPDDTDDRDDLLCDDSLRILSRDTQIMRTTWSPMMDVSKDTPVPFLAGRVSSRRRCPSSGSMPCDAHSPSPVHVGSFSMPVCAAPCCSSARVSSERPSLASDKPLLSSFVAGESGSERHARIFHLPPPTPRTGPCPSHLPTILLPPIRTHSPQDDPCHHSPLGKANDAPVLRVSRVDRSAVTDLAPFQLFSSPPRILPPPSHHCSPPPSHHRSSPQCPDLSPSVPHLCVVAHSAQPSVHMGSAFRPHHPAISRLPLVVLRTHSRLSSSEARDETPRSSKKRKRTSPSPARTYERNAHGTCWDGRLHDLPVPPIPADEYLLRKWSYAPLRFTDAACESLALRSLHIKRRPAAWWVWKAHEVLSSDPDVSTETLGRPLSAYVDHVRHPNAIGAQPRALAGSLTLEQKMQFASAWYWYTTTGGCKKVLDDYLDLGFVVYLTRPHVSRIPLKDH